MSYGSQPWPVLMDMDVDELMQAYHCVALIKKAESDATKDATTKAKEERADQERAARRERLANG